MKFFDFLELLIGYNSMILFRNMCFILRIKEKYWKVPFTGLGVFDTEIMKILSFRTLGYFQNIIIFSFLFCCFSFFTHFLIWMRVPHVLLMSAHNLYEHAPLMGRHKMTALAGMLFTPAILLRNTIIKVSRYRYTKTTRVKRQLA